MASTSASKGIGSLARALNIFWFRARYSISALLNIFLCRVIFRCANVFRVNRIVTRMQYSTGYVTSETPTCDRTKRGRNRYPRAAPLQQATPIDVSTMQTSPRDNCPPSPAIAAQLSPHISAGSLHVTAGRSRKNQRRDSSATTAATADNPGVIPPCRVPVPR